MTTLAPHKNIEINLTDSGKFRAMINGQLVLKTSLAAIKKAIDDSKKVVFEPFEALAEVKYGYKGLKECPSLRRAKVIRIERSKTGSEYNRRPRFISVDGYRADQLLADTPENIKLSKQIDDFKKETRRIMAERAKVKDELQEKLTWLKAENYLKGGAK